MKLGVRMLGKQPILTIDVLFPMGTGGGGLAGDTVPPFRLGSPLLARTAPEL